MKSHRFGVWGLALGAVLLSAACDDQTEVVIPTPPPDPITVAVTPASLSLQIGQTAQFVAAVSGGAQGTARTVTWASSNTAVATVNASGLVTAVATGVSTITATSTADNTARSAAAVTVTADPANAPVTISIQSITTGTTVTPVDINNVSRQIDVTLNLEGSPPAVISRVETLIDGTVVCSQSFSTGGGDVASSDEAQSNVEIVCSINTAAFNATTGETTWKNGPHNLQARAVRPNGQVVATPSTTLVFNNTNFINATFTSSGTPRTSLPAPRSLSAAGTLWHTGDITVNLLPVNYGAAANAVATATVSLTTSGFGVNGLAGCVVSAAPIDATTNPTIAVNDGGAGPTIDPDGAGPLAANPALPGCAVTTAAKVGTAATPIAITFPANATMTATSPGVMAVEEVLAVTVNSVTTGGQTGPVCINPDPVANPQGPLCGTYFANPLRVDNLAPRLTQLSIERPPNQYFGPNVFTLSHAAGGTTPACTAPCARTVDYGVGGQTSTGNATFIAGPPAATQTVASGGAGLAESATSTDYVFGVTVMDATGNTRTNYATATTTTTNTTATAASNRRFGWDATKPTQTVASGPANMAVNPDETLGTINPFTINFVDSAVPPAGPSGFLTNPVATKVERYRASQATNPTCHNPETFAAVSCTTNGGFVNGDGSYPTPGSTGPVTEGYFNYSFQTADAAANVSDLLSRWHLEDVTAPTLGGITAPSTIPGGASAPFTSDASDNVELGSVVAYLGADAVELGVPRQTIGTFGFDQLTGALLLQVTMPRFMRSFQLNNGAGLPGAGPFMTDRVVFNVRDMAGEQLRYVGAPQGPAGNEGYCPVYPAANVATQNCRNVRQNIAFNVLAGAGGAPVAAQFGDLATLNGANAAHGLFLMQAPSVSVVCNNAARTDCPATNTPTSTEVSTTLTGPAGSFASPFVEVRFYFGNNEGRFDYIGAGTVSVSDNTVSNTRTYTYRTTWDVSNPRVRPAGVAGTGYTVVAVGFNATGDGLGATPSTPITVHGN